jgi:pimeloyl-ACP methyl ester carboxylesterase
VLRYDERRCGLSDRDVEDVSLEARLADLQAVIDAAGMEHIAILGISQGGPIAIAFAARHPERVSRLVLFATFARGRLMRDPLPADREQAHLMESLIRMGWGQGLPRSVVCSPRCSSRAQTRSRWSGSTSCSG